MKKKILKINTIFAFNGEYFFRTRYNMYFGMPV
jgi:hypothetical protein